eukprot:scaffold184096_cov74-Attheya_sp.AAC.1
MQTAANKCDSSLPAGSKLGSLLLSRVVRDSLLCLRATQFAHTSKAFIAQGLFETSVDVTHSFFRLIAGHRRGGELATGAIYCLL